MNLKALFSLMNSKGYHQFCGTNLDKHFILTFTEETTNSLVSFSSFQNDIWQVKIRTKNFDSELKNKTEQEIFEIIQNRI